MFLIFFFLCLLPEALDELSKLDYTYDSSTAPNQPQQWINYQTLEFIHCHKGDNIAIKNARLVNGNMKNGIRKINEDIKVTNIWLLSTGSVPL